jgi:hypothetical protein
MAFVGRDGTVGGREQKSIVRRFKDLIRGIFDFVGLFFSAVMNPPQTLENRGNYAQRNNGNMYRVSGGGGRSLNGANLRGMKNLSGGAKIPGGGGWGR